MNVYKLYITRNYRISRNTVNLATACCSCLVDVGLIRRGFREGGIKMLILGANVRPMRVRPICSAASVACVQGRTAHSGYVQRQPDVNCLRAELVSSLRVHVY